MFSCFSPHKQGLGIGQSLLMSQDGGRAPLPEMWESEEPIPKNRHWAKVRNPDSVRINPRGPDRPQGSRHREWTVHSGRPMTRKDRNEQRTSRPLRISKEETGCSVFLYKVAISVLPLVFVCAAFKEAKNVWNQILFTYYIFTLMFLGTSVISAAPDVWAPLVESPGPLVFLLET